MRVTKPTVGSRFRRTFIGDRLFYEKVIAIVLPIIIQNTVSNVVSLLDNVMVGRVGTLEMSAVSIVNQLLFIFYLCIFGGLAGAGIFATQFAGAGDDEGVRQCFRIKWLIAAMMLLVASAVFLLLPTQLIGMYLADGTSAADAASTLAFGTDYLMVMLIGLIPFAVSQIYASTLREVGETRLPMIASIAAILVNLVFNYLLIFGKFGFPKLGVTGAAIATVISRYVEVAIIMIYTHARSTLFSFIRGAYRSIYVSAKLLGDVFRRGMPLLVNEFFWSSGMAVLLQCYSVRGLDVVAACNITSTVANLFKVVFLSMGNAVAIMVGQALGAGNVPKARKTLIGIYLTGMVTSLIFSLVIALAVVPLGSLYTKDPMVIEDCKTTIWYMFAMCIPAMSINGMDPGLRTGGDSKWIMLYTIFGVWAIRVPLTYLFCYSMNLGVPGLFLANIISLVFRALCSQFRFHTGKWLHKNV